MPKVDDRKVVLHVGCGRAKLPVQFQSDDWREIRLDVDPNVTPDIVAGMTDMSQVDSGTVDAVWSSHNLEHLYAHEVPAAITEFHRVLKDNGVVFIVTPDTQVVAREIARGNLEGSLYRSPAGPIAAIDIFWGHRAAIRDGNVHMGHRTGFTARTLEQKLLAAGFGAVRVEQRPKALELFAAAQKIALAQPIEVLMKEAAQRHKAGRWQEAETLYRQVVAHQNSYWIAWHELGVVCYAQERVDDAIACMRRAVALQPTSASAHRALGTFLGVAGHPRAAVKHLQQSLALDSNSAEAHYNLGKAWQEQNSLTLAEEAYRHAIRIAPDHALAHLNLGQIVNRQGDAVHALHYYQTALKLKPTAAWMRSNIAMILNFIPGRSSAEVFAAHCEFERQHVAPLASAAKAHPNTPDPERRLKIGYVSRDLRQHSVSYFMKPILELHDRVRQEVFCYYTNPKHDAVTVQFHKYAEKWVDCARLDDAALAERIREDKIDILVDLGGHTDRNRLLTFGRKPAPVQITYLGYPTTTGLKTIDYRITDRYIDPQPDDPEILSSEVPLRLEHGFFCYEPLPDSPYVNELPALGNGYVTFGSLNQQPKLNPELLSWWAETLRKIRGSKLVIQNSAVHMPEVRQQVLDQFKSLGIDPSRLSFSKYEKVPVYLKSYHDVDIALDTFPYNGGTTTCEALWMGVPVISMSGKRQVSRLGLSILSHVGLPELIADTPKAYIETAVRLARDLPRLEDLRKNMRDRMRSSPLTDAEGFVRELEAAYRTVWRRWCATRTGGESKGFAADISKTRSRN